ncbi:cytospin-A-like isoform X2 [Arapaima gigas]
MGSLGSVTASGIRLRCKCVINPNPGMKVVSQPVVFQPTMAWGSKAISGQHTKEVTIMKRMGRTATKTSSAAAPTKMNHCSRIPQKTTTFKTKKRPDINMVAAAPVSSPRDNKATSNSCYAAKLWASSVPMESNADQNEQHSRLGTSRNSLVAVMVTRASQDVPEVQVEQAPSLTENKDYRIAQLQNEPHQTQIRMASRVRPPIQIGEAGKRTDDVSCFQEVCTNDIQVSKEQPENIVAELEEELEKKCREITLLKDNLAKLKEEFDTHCDEAKREADLQRGKVVEKEAQVADLKEVIYELEDEVEQHRAVKLYDNHTIAYLESEFSGLV